MDKRKSTRSTDAADKPNVKPSSSNSQCKIITNDENVGRNKIEYYHVPSFKTEMSGHIYNCIHCNNTYYDSETVKEHLGTVHCDYHYYCEYCGEFFSTYWKLKRHQKQYTYNCEHCDYCTNHYTRFRLHNSRTHKVKMKPKFHIDFKLKKSYECEFCGYQVIRPHMYKKHMKTIHNQDVDI